MRKRREETKFQKFQTPIKMNTFKTKLKKLKSEAIDKQAVKIKITNFKEEATKRFKLGCPCSYPIASMKILEKTMYYDNN